MKIIEHASNQYFIIDGNDVYASLSETLQTHKYILLMKGGETALRRALDEDSLTIVTVFDFLNKLSETPVLRGRDKSISDYKLELYDAIFEFVVPLRTYAYYLDCTNQEERDASFEKIVSRNVVLHNRKGAYHFELGLKKHKVRETSFTSLHFDFVVGFTLNGKPGGIAKTIAYSQHNQLIQIIGDALWEIMLTEKPTQEYTVNLR